MSTPDRATGYETGLDDVRPDVITETEAQGLYRWYAETHGEGNNQLTRFVPLLVEHCPGAFKRYRRNSDVIRSTGQRLPLRAVGLCFLHSYIVLGRRRESFYEVIAARKWGATKREVLGTIQLAFLEAGPAGLNAVAALAEAYVRDWPEAEAEPGEPWPPDWRVDAMAAPWAAGNVERLARQQPKLAEALRDRFDHARRDSGLPVQMIPLLRLHTATIRRQSETVRAAALEALRLGVDTTQILEPVLFASLYADEETMDIAALELDAILETWPQSGRAVA
jgi:alkylhydroperoxidase/carboxymuconolactone decarboxylase family protein YurZ